LASEAQLAQVGRPIAGVEGKRELEKAAELAATYGGNTEDWIQKSSSDAFKSSDGTHVETHWFENKITGERVHQKTKIRP
jgi:hypothetical protein